MFQPLIHRWDKFHKTTIACQGNAEQKSQFFGYALQGYRFANALSETGGKTVQDIQTCLSKLGDSLVINGRKGYCTGSFYAHWIGILALDEEDHAQLAFVARETPGLKVINNWDCLGQRTTSSGMVLAENLHVFASDLIPTWLSYDKPTLGAANDCRD